MIANSYVQVFIDSTLLLFHVQSDLIAQDHAHQVVQVQRVLVEGSVEAELGDQQIRERLYLEVQRRKVL